MEDNPYESPQHVSSAPIQPRERSLKRWLRVVVYGFIAAAIVLLLCALFELSLQTYWWLSDPKH